MLKHCSFIFNEPIRFLAYLEKGNQYNWERHWRRYPSVNYNTLCHTIILKQMFLLFLLRNVYSSQCVSSNMSEMHQKFFPLHFTNFTSLFYNIFKKFKYFVRLILYYFPYLWFKVAFSVVELKIHWLAIQCIWRQQEINNNVNNIIEILFEWSYFQISVVDSF